MLFVTLFALCFGLSATSARTHTLSGRQHGPSRLSSRQPQAAKQSIFHGVNIGGWLVTEPWITPSLYDATNDPNVIDEYTYGVKYRSIEASRRLEQHWSTFCTEVDFREIAAAGLTHVRIPVGYWAYWKNDTEPYPTGQAPWLHRSLGWARRAGLKVMIDLHGAPGSQNGFDNSGRRGDANWANSQDDIDRVIKVLNIMSRIYSGEFSDVVTSIAVLNEPAAFLPGTDFVGGTYIDTLKPFYEAAYKAIRFPWFEDGDVTESPLTIVYHDAYQKPSTWSSWPFLSTARNIAFDYHSYNIFSVPELLGNDNLETLTNRTCARVRDLQQLDSIASVIIGEWTAALTDCAKYLNGRGKGSRWEDEMHRDCSAYNTSTPDAAQLEMLQQSVEIQASAYSRLSGTAWWTWKAEDAVQWSYRDGLRLDYISRQRSDIDVCAKYDA